MEYVPRKSVFVDGKEYRHTAEWVNRDLKAAIPDSVLVDAFNKERLQTYQTLVHGVEAGVGLDLIPLYANRTVVLDAWVKRLENQRLIDQDEALLNRCLELLLRASGKRKSDLTGEDIQALTLVTFCRSPQIWGSSVATAFESIKEQRELRSGARPVQVRSEPRELIKGTDGLDFVNERSRRAFEELKELYAKGRTLPHPPQSSVGLGSPERNLNPAAQEFLDDLVNESSEFKSAKGDPAKPIPFVDVLYNITLPSAPFHMGAMKAALDDAAASTAKSGQTDN